MIMVIIIVYDSSVACFADKASHGLVAVAQVVQGLTPDPWLSIC